ncbi:hypothetical protein V8C26DRAFT_394647 [Trichoderma gracile]
MDPPPSSQSHFSKFNNFTPSQNTPFDQEFALLALSQDWTPGSQQYTKQRTIALREELKTHYFSSQSQSQSQSQPSSSIDSSSSSTQQLTEEEILKGYQDLCTEVDITPSPSVMECKRQLRKKLVNIVDLIDARRTGSKVRVWCDFDAFRAYTLKDEHRINKEEAKQDGGFLASLLQHLRNPRAQRRARMKRAAMEKRG